MSNAQRPPVAAVILNYRTPGLTIDCLGSLEAERGSVPGLVAVVVDNASGDGSVDAIRRAVEARGWGGWVDLVEAPVNAGFAEGNNVALRRVEAERYLLLNSDTLVRPGAVAALVRALDARPDVGIVGPRLEWPDGRPQNSCFRCPTPLTELVAAAATGPVSRLLGDHVVAIEGVDGPFEPEWISFACVLVRRAVIERVGLLDGGYFMYFEDVDYGRQARDAGWTILHWPEARVVHLHGQSGPVERHRAELKRRPAYYYAARTRYYAKFYGRAGLWAANLLWLLGRAIAGAREVVGQKPPHACRREALDIWTNWRRPMATSRPGSPGHQPS